MKHILYALFLCVSLFANAQTQFQLFEKYSHYYFTTTVNEKDSITMMIESGIPGVLMGKTYYEQLFSKNQYSDCLKKLTSIKSHGKSYTVLQSLEGCIHIGQLAYTGPIYILDNFDNIYLPVHLVSCSCDSTLDIVCLNFKDKHFKMVPRTLLDLEKYQRFSLINMQPWITIKSTVCIKDRKGHKGIIDDDFIVDFGNSMELAFFNNEKFSKFIKNNNIIVDEAIDKNRNKKIGFGILAKKLTFDKKEFYNTNVLVADIGIKKYIGCLGVKYFKGEIFIDKNNMTLYYE